MIRHHYSKEKLETGHFQGLKGYTLVCSAA